MKKYIKNIQLTHFFIEEQFDAHQKAMREKKPPNDSYESSSEQDGKVH